jgi:hypothetical protein
VDARAVDPKWIEDVLRDAPMPVKRVPLSHNAADSQSVLIVVGVLFVALIFKPFVTTIANEAGKDTYAAMRSWLRRLLSKLSDRRNPIVEVQSFHAGCQVSFIFRGKDIKRHYAAHDALPHAAAHAKHLVEGMRRVGFAPKLVIYEFQDDKWFPSYAELPDGRFITDNRVLIAVEQLPTGLSLGLSVGEERPLLPDVKRIQ